jgi:murein DD-endopeptidase MepM/ murein hydrolase activator NlpD
MRRAALLALALLLALLAGTARADTFAVVSSAPFELPGLTPNPTLNVPDALSTPPSSPERLSYSQLLGLWQQAGSSYGIPWQVLASINKIESNWGRNMGPSSAGAIGWMQFMPSTWLRWGTDANGDGVADPWSATDAIYSAARYLAAAGGTTDLYRGVYAYNHADWYVREVLSLADLYGNDSTVAFTLDRQQASLDAARADAARAGERVSALARTVRAQGRLAARWQRRADHATLLSDRLELEQRAGAARERRAAAATALEQRQQELATAQAALADAERESAAAGFNPAASQLLSAPTYSGGYVFPVGGGPGVISVSHTHHDYPAADIAAPMGSPLYALADSTVLRSWTVPDPRCGIGFTVRAFDGQVWTYCHMSVLNSNVVPGAQLSAGDSVGLVGATGHATGPHLHLQLQPASAWPQQEAWFQSFAGKAFTWSDGDVTLDPAPSRALAFAQTPAKQRVFEVVPAAESTAPVVYFNRS